MSLLASGDKQWIAELADAGHQAHPDQADIGTR